MPLRRYSIALGLIALTTLVIELVMTRVFDVILYPHMAYMVIACAVFCLGLGGIVTTLRPVPEDVDPGERLANVSLLYAGTTLAIHPLLNAMPFDFALITEEPVRQALAFLGMYAAVAVPFFLAGLVFATMFTAWAEHIQRLYFFDLVGAAIGCVVVVPLLPPLGPGGILYLAATAILVAAALFTSRRPKAWVAVAMAVGVAAVPLVWIPEYIDFVEHKPDRGARRYRQAGMSELVRWDPISKVEVVDIGPVKNILLDGGSQSSFIYPFDAEYGVLRREVLNAIEAGDEGGVLRHFWHRGVLVSHWLRRDRGQKVLVIGAAGGQEIKAAQMLGAGEVHAVEMVGTLLDIGVDEYGLYNGQVFRHPEVELFHGEGRAFLRSRDDRYDIIQVFSNHSTSSAAAGAGAMDPTYLQTVEAYQEYFARLTDDGILHFKHPVYPRMVVTAARAWEESGRSDFRRHVVVVLRTQVEFENIPTFLIGRVEPDPELYTTHGTATRLNVQLEEGGGIPFDVAHLVVTAFVSLFFAVVFVVVPLLFARVGRRRWAGKIPSLVYFSCLGAGFIILELVLIQQFMRFIGFPLHTYSTVIFTLLAAAGTGSLASSHLGIGPERRWTWPFAGVLGYGLFLLLTHSLVFDVFLGLPAWGRIAVAFVYLFPLGFFLGMPFPLGVLTVERASRDAVAWAWGMNGLFTVIGGLASVLLSIYLGFVRTEIVGLALYGLALVSFVGLRRRVSA